MSPISKSFAPIVVCLAFGFAACGDDSTKDSGDVVTTLAPSGGAVDVMLADSSLGQILVDGNGMTLYILMTDGPDTPTCTGDCAVEWPPMPADGDLTFGEGLDAALFTTVTGVSGPQLSFNGHPLYYFLDDEAPGDTNGQNDENFFVIGADGEPITA